MASIQLSATVRSNLLSLKRTTELMNRTSERISSELEVAHASDNPGNYYAAKNLSTSAETLEYRLDGMSESASVINSADNGISSIQSYLSQMQGLVDDALASTDSDARRDYGTQFNELVNQIRNIATDSDYDGVNLLVGNEYDTVQFSDYSGNATITVNGINISAAKGDPDENGEIGSSSVIKSEKAVDVSGNTYMAVSSYALTFDSDGGDVVGIKSAGTDGDAWEIDWGSDDYQTLLSDLESQIETMDNSLAAQSVLLAADLATITMREDFTENKITILNEGADALTLCDLNEESANLLTLKTATSLGVQCLSSTTSMASQALAILGG